MFNNAKDQVGFVDGHVSYLKIYWNSNTVAGFASFAVFYNPPAEYEYQWTGD